MPKSLYRKIRSEDGLVSASTKRGSIYTDKQVVAPLLCDDCEEMFSEKGERVVCGECFRREETFVLREKLKEKTETLVEGGKDWIIPQRLPASVNLDYEAYLYFGASIIWRASAGRWPREVGRIHGCLGSYEEKFGRYLIGETDFPKNVYLLVFVNFEEEDRDEGFSSIVSFPFQVRLKGRHWHVFCVPGVIFMFVVSRMFGDIESMFKTINTPILFFEEIFREHVFFKSFPEKMLEPKGRLAKEMEGLKEKYLKIRSG